MTRRTLFAAAALTLAAVAPQAQAAVVIDYSSFTAACGTTLNCVGNTAATASGALRVAPAASYNSGAGYSKTAIELGAGATFSTSFQFRLTNPGGIDPADGFTFVVAQDSTSLGGVGGGLGYQGVDKSVAIEFDTYDNGERSSNHVALDKNGSLASLVQVDPYGVGNCHLANYTDAGCMSNGKVWSAFINYDGTTKLLNVSVQEEGAALIQLITNYSLDIADILGVNNAYVGFTSATGSGWQNHDILNWRLANDTSITTVPGSVPEPAGLALLTLAGGAALLAGRRRRA